MPTILFDSTIFGPVRSRRLGVSLGVNLLPTVSKYCNFNCIYCECGWTEHRGRPALPTRGEVRLLLLQKLEAMRQAGEPLDVITFAGNGEPTIHPDFAEIIEDTLEARQRFYPDARVVVLSNATMLDRPKVRLALQRVDQAALKLDSALDDTMRRIDEPQGGLTVAKIVARLSAMGHDYTLQTMFLRGEYKGQRVDNTTEHEVGEWLKVLESLRPRDVMVYTIDRDTPIPTLEKVPLAELEAIGERVRQLGIPVQVRG